MGGEWTLQDVKNRFSAVVDAALAGEPSNGRTTAA
jgi:antitoxin (DNA-binding transcriptional repressor) of toxin-antitoxin stability system